MISGDTARVITINRLIASLKHLVVYHSDLPYLVAGEAEAWSNLFP